MALAARFVPAAVVGDLHRLEGFACAVFGRRDRPPGWFERKLRREHIDPELSRLAVLASAPPQPRPEHWLGYVLVGTPPSLAPVVRTGGTGVVAWARGRGIAGALLDDAARVARARGCRAIELAAELGMASFYEQRGFRPGRREHTLLAFGRGRPDAPPQLVETDHESIPDGLQTVVDGYLAEAWIDTPGVARRCVLVGEARVCFTVEGRAWVIHRVLAPTADAGTTSLLELVDAAPEGTPLVVPGCDPVSSVTSDLEGHGWAIAQRAVVLRRRLDKA